MDIEEKTYQENVSIVKLSRRTVRLSKTVGQSDKNPQNMEKYGNTGVANLGATRELPVFSVSRIG